MFSELATTIKLKSSFKTLLFEFRKADELKLVEQETTKLSHWVTVQGRFYFVTRTNIICKMLRNE